MEQRDFGRTLGDLASTLGDGTRRGIYITVRESAQPMTATHIAEAFNIHPNVARHHLDRLVEDGYLQASTWQPPADQPRKAGRPAKRYRATDKEISVAYPARRYDLLSELLVRVAERLSPERAPEVAEEVGRQYGRDIAEAVGMPGDEGYSDTLSAMVRALTDLGAGVKDIEGRLVTRDCPFHQTAANHPEIVCRLDQGIVKGLLDAVDAADDVVFSPRSGPDESCITEI
jgi:predicted ArsR family transcriptional regulator